MNDLITMNNLHSFTIYKLFTFNYHIFQDFQNKEIYMGLVIQQHFTICHLISWQYILSPTLGLNST